MRHYYWTLIAHSLLQFVSALNADTSLLHSMHISRAVDSGEKNSSYILSRIAHEFILHGVRLCFRSKSFRFVWRYWAVNKGGMLEPPRTNESIECEALNHQNRSRQSRRVCAEMVFFVPSILYPVISLSSLFHSFAGIVCFLSRFRRTLTDSIYFRFIERSRRRKRNTIAFLKTLSYTEIDRTVFAEQENQVRWCNSRRETFRRAKQGCKAALAAGACQRSVN